MRKEPMAARNCCRLDGGWPAWTGAGLPVEQTQAPIIPSDHLPSFREEQVVSTPDVQGWLAAKGAPMLLDARATARSRGEVEPLDPVAGHGRDPAERPGERRGALAAARRRRGGDDAGRRRRRWQGWRSDTRMAATMVATTRAVVGAEVRVPAARAVMARRQAKAEDLALIPAQTTVGFKGVMRSWGADGTAAYAQPKGSREVKC